MVFGLFNKDDKAPQEDIDLARAHYVLRTATPEQLAEILQDVTGKLSPEGRQEWSSRLTEIGLGAGGDDAEASRGVAAKVAELDDAGRDRFAETITPELAELIGSSTPAFAAFEGFPGSPEATDVGEEDEHRGERSRSLDDTREGGRDLSGEVQGGHG